MEAKLSNPAGAALSIEGADISDGAFLRKLEANGGVSALDSRIRGQIDLTGAKLSNPDGNVLGLEVADM